MKLLAIALTALIAAWLVITIGAGPVSVFVWVSVGDLWWVAVLEALLIALATTVHNIDLKAKIGRRFGSVALLLAFLVAGCATSRTPTPAASTPKDDASPCVTSNWAYAWIDDCAPGGPDRITWPEWWGLQLADKIAEMREP